MPFSTVWNAIENETWKPFFDTLNVLQTCYFVTLEAAVQVWIITVSSFSHLMWHSSLSYIVVSRNITLVWFTKSDSKESSVTDPRPNLPPSVRSIIPCIVVWPRAHIPPSFSQHLIKALADFASPDIWEKQTTERLPGESGRLCDTNSAQIMNICTFYTKAKTHWSAKCSLIWHPTVFCQPQQPSFIPKQEKNKS